MVSLVFLVFWFTGCSCFLVFWFLWFLWFIGFSGLLVSSAWLPWFPASCCYLSFQRNPPQADIVLLNLSTSEGGELAVPASRVTLEVVRARDGKPSSWAQLSVESEWSPEQGFDQGFLLELVLRYQFSCRLSLGSGWFH